MSLNCLGDITKKCMIGSLKFNLYLLTNVDDLYTYVRLDLGHFLFNSLSNQGDAKLSSKLMYIEESFFKIAYDSDSGQVALAIQVTVATDSNLLHTVAGIFTTTLKM